MTQDFFVFQVMTLAVTYAANVGGIGALTGTSPNVIMAGQANRYSVI